MNNKLLPIFLIVFLIVQTTITKVQSQTDLSEHYFKELYKNAHHLKTRDIDENRFEDLEEIGKSIGEARIVLLGEPNHGDGGALEMKSRLVRYLHEEMDFDVLLFEADMYSIINAMTNIKDTARINILAKENIYSCWSESKVNHKLWDYYKKQLLGPDPIELGGFDCRHAGSYAKQNLTNNLKIIAESCGTNTNTDQFRKTIKDINYILHNEFRSIKDSVHEKNFNATINQLEEKLKFNLDNQKKRKLWLIELQNLRGWFAFVINNANRDIAMASNLIYLVKYLYPNKKVIVWSHNNHNVLDVNTYVSSNQKFYHWWHKNNTYESFSYVGASLFREFGNQVYSLAISSGIGNYSPKFFTDDMFHSDFSKSAKIKESGNEALETFLKSKNCVLTFLPFPKGNQGYPSGYPWFSARLLDLVYEAKLDYTSAFNGIIYINSTIDLNGE